MLVVGAGAPESLAWNGHWDWAVLDFGHLWTRRCRNLGQCDSRLYVLNSDVKLHPLLAFISVLGGLQWLGLWGVFIGPVVASCLHALIEIFNTELIFALG